MVIGHSGHPHNDVCRRYVQAVSVEAHQILFRGIVYIPPPMVTNPVSVSAAIQLRLTLCVCICPPGDVSLTSVKTDVVCLYLPSGGVSLTSVKIDVVCLYLPSGGVSLTSVNTEHCVPVFALRRCVAGFSED